MAHYRWYPDRESNSELSFRRALLYPFNYQGVWFSRAKVVIKGEMAKLSGTYFSDRCHFCHFKTPAILLRASSRRLRWVAMFRRI